MRLLKFLFIFCIISLPAFAADISVDKVVLDNGMTVLIEPMPSVETISIYAYVKTGSATEGKFLGSGISHFVEHMLFKGTTKRKVGDIAKEVKGIGGVINAHTSFDYTMYTLDVPKGNLTQGLDIISDMLINSSFDGAQVDKERPVIHGEMRLYHDRPDRTLSELVYQNVYIQHPYRHPIIGYEILFDQITRDQLFEYYKTRYIPNNIILSIAGAVNKEEVLQQVKDAFSNFKPLPYPDRHVPQEPPQITQRRYTEEYSTELYRFSLSFQGVGMLDPDIYAMDVLSMALGQGESSRLYREVYQDQGLVKSISASNFTPQDKGVFEIEGVTGRDNIDAIVKAVQAIIARMASHGLAQEELEKTKRQVLAQHVFANQTSHGVAYRNAVDEAMTGDRQFSAHYVQAVKAVANEDIKRVVNKYLNTDNYTLVVLKPRQAPIGQVAKKEVERLPIQKIVLDNGLTILLHEDHHSQVVALHLVMNAGTRQEEARLNGVAQLTSQVWSKGTLKMDAKALAMAMERRGASVGAFTGRNSLGIKMDVLADDFDFALDVLAGIVKTPAFDSKIIEQERQQLLTSIDARDDDITSVTFKELIQTLFLTHPFRLDRLGTKATVAHITKKDIEDYYHRFAVPNNMVLSVIGDFKIEGILPKIKEKFAAFKSQEVKLEQFTEAVPDKTREKDLLMDKEQAVVSLAFQAPPIQAQDRWGMEIIDGVLGAGLSGRLFVKVRDELGKAYTLGSDYVPGIDAGVFFIYVLTTSDKAQAVKDILLKEIDALRTIDISDGEITEVKNYLKGTLRMSLDTPAALASMSGFNELYGMGYDLHQRYATLIESVGPKDIKRIARQYLDLAKAAVVITNGKKKVE